GGGVAEAARVLDGLRAEGADGGLVLGGPAGPELAATCTTRDDLAAAYREIVTTCDPAFLDFDVRDAADHVAVLRRALAIRAVQEELPVRVAFTLRLQPYGLAARDVEMLRLTRRHGAEITTVNLLAELGAREPSEAWDPAVRAAQEQIADAHGLTDSRESWRRVALTPLLARPSDLSEADARRLSSFAARNGLAWLSVRGAAPRPAVSRVLWRTPA
ncbi:hypothetical protein, partial [Nonomuraea lactucae]|uniref:hypothetical protein n=1 Tax=Nonomuraea lactucae TaxID=2249762 RepID=UPI001962BBED